MNKFHNAAAVWMCIWGVGGVALNSYATQTLQQADFTGLRLLAGLMLIVALLGLIPLRSMPHNTLQRPAHPKLPPFVLIVVITVSFFGWLAFARG